MTTRRWQIVVLVLAFLTATLILAWALVSAGYSPARHLTGLPHRFDYSVLRVKNPAVRDPSDESFFTVKDPEAGPVVVNLRLGECLLLSLDGNTIAHHHLGRPMRLDGVWDISGDSRREIFLSRVAGGRLHCRVYDQSGNLVSRFSYGVQGADSTLCKWTAVRGVIHLGEANNTAANGSCRSSTLVVYNFVGDKPGTCNRHVAAVDPLTGEVRWTYSLPAVPSFIRTGDLTGDGMDELVFTTPGIRNGCKANGLADSAAYLFALSAHGRPVWRARIGGGGIGGDCCLADLDGDGVLEVVTATGSTDESQELRGRIAVWNGRTGEFVTDFRQAESFDVEPAGISPDGNSPGAIFTLDSGMTVRKFVLSQGELIEENSCFTDAYLPNWALPPVAADVIGDIQKEVLVLTGYGEITCFNQTFDPLARLSLDLDEDNKGEQRLLQFLGKHSDPQLTFAADRFYAMSVASNPWFPVRASIVALVLGFLLTVVVALMIPGTRHFVIDGAAAIADRARSILPDPVAARRVLSERIEFNDHGSLTLKSRLRNLAGSVTALAGGVGSREEMTRVLLDKLAEFRTTLKEELAELARLCIAARVATSSARVVRRQAKAMTKTAARLNPDTVTIPEWTLEDLSRRSRLLMAALEEIEDAVISLYQSDLAAAIDRVVNEKSEFFDDDIKLEVDHAVDNIKPVNLEERDLLFILENLVDNSVHAMEDSAEKILGISVRPVEDYVEVLVSDTGCGIPPESIPGIFEGESTRGGGRGLARSKDILSRRAGSIKVLDSEVGKGTTFVVRIRHPRKNM